MDTWFAMDPNTGVKQEVLSFNKPDKTCPIDSSNAVYIGRTGKREGRGKEKTEKTSSCVYLRHYNDFKFEVAVFKFITVKTS